jgi:DUF4097 and DUF4098 domain-containing protein YvlB
MAIFICGELAKTKEFFDWIERTRQKVKRTILTITILTIALAAVAVNRSRVTRADSARAQIETAPVVAPQPQEDQELTEEFHQSYALSPTGRVSIENINGPVHITVWDQSQVKVDAVKRARRQEGLANVKIDVTATPDSVRIRSKYPDWNQDWDSKEERGNQGASVEYSLTIPRKARVESADLVNGSLDIDGVEGDVEANLVNGRLKAENLGGGAKLSTVNGAVDVSLTRLDETKKVSLNSVNGRLVLTLPAGANAQVKASTIHGGITNDFGLQVTDTGFVGHELEGQIGSGGPRIRLSNVNGAISIKRG